MVVVNYITAVRLKNLDFFFHSSALAFTVFTKCGQKED